MVFFGLEAEEYDRQYSDKELRRRIFDYFKMYKGQMGIVVIFMFLTSISYGILPLFTSSALKFVAKGESPLLIIYIIIFIFILNALSWIFNYFIQINSAKSINSIILKIRNDAARSVIHQDLSFFDKFSTGKISSRINADTTSFGEAATLLIDSTSSLLSVVIIMIPMFIVNWVLSLVVLTMIPFIFLLTLKFRKGARSRSLLGQRSTAEVNAFIQETMSGIQITKTFRQEEKLFEHFEEINKKSYKVNLRRALFLNLMFPELMFIRGVVVSAITLISVGLIQSGTFYSTDFFLFLSSLGALFFPLFSIASFWPQFQTGMSAAERIFALIDSETSIKQSDSLSVGQLEGEIDIDNLTFNYGGSSTLIFDNFNLSIKKGESLAIVGHTGAGKSSLVHVLLRFYEFAKGQINIDGKDIRSLDLQEYRSQIGFIPQTPILWADTLENNITYGNSNISRERVLWALDHAGGREWVEDLPEGLDTNIRERGSLLSMGLRQLVIIARVILQDPKILILDEATASVDPFTEVHIQAAIDRLMEGRTTIIIAHRLRTVKHVDRIIVLDHGTIVEEGNHKELLEKEGVYSNLYNTYFKHQSFEFLEAHRK